MAATPDTLLETATRADVPISEARRIFSELYTDSNIMKIQELDSYSDRNFYVCLEPETEYVLKIMCKSDSNLAYIRAIANFLILVDTKNLPFKCSKPILSKNGNTVEMITLPTDPDPNAKYCVILLTYIPGKMLKQVYRGNNIDLSLLYQLGKNLAQFETILMGYYDPGLEFRNGYLWDTANVRVVGQYIPKIKDYVDLNDLELLEKYYGKFLEQIEPNLAKFHKNPIHSDLNEMNLLLSPAGELTGVIDFTDTVYSYTIFELGNMIAYIMMHCYSEGTNPFQVGRHLIQGFLSEVKLSKLELDCLLVASTGRMVMTSVMGYYYYSLEPTNEYLLSCPKPAISLLRYISQTGHPAIEEIFFKPL